LEAESPRQKVDGIMVANANGRQIKQRPPDRGDAAQRLRLIQLTHSDNDVAAAIATATLLLLRRLDEVAA